MTTLSAPAPQAKVAGNNSEKHINLFQLAGQPGVRADLSFDNWHR